MPHDKTSRPTPPDLHACGVGEEMVVDRLVQAAIDVLHHDTTEGGTVDKYERRLLLEKFDAILAIHNPEKEAGKRVCEECGLPFPVCNALARHRDAIKYFKLGRTEDANEAAQSATYFYEEYISTYRTGEREAEASAPTEFTLVKRPVAWRVNFKTEPLIYDDEATAKNAAEENDVDYQGLYVDAPERIADTTKLNATNVLLHAEREKLAAIKCRYGCDSPVVGLFSTPEGCLCWPDQMQALCAQHASKIDGGPVICVVDFRKFTDAPGDWPTVAYILKGFAIKFARSKTTADENQHIDDAVEAIRVAAQEYPSTSSVRPLVKDQT